MTESPWPEKPQDYEAAKLIAAALMLVNHATLPLGGNIALLGELASRTSMPLFALILLARLTEKVEKRLPALQMNLLIWGIISIPVCLWFHHAEVPQANILLVFLVGTFLIQTSRAEGRYRLKPLAVMLALAALTATPYLEYTGLVPIAMWTAAPLMQKRPIIAMTILMAATVAAQADNPEKALWMAAATLPLPLILIISKRAGRWVPRLPRHAFYAFYPASFVVGIILKAA